MQSIKSNDYYPIHGGLDIILKINNNGDLEIVDNTE